MRKIRDGDAGGIALNCWGKRSKKNLPELAFFFKTTYIFRRTTVSNARLNPAPHKLTICPRFPLAVADLLPHALQGTQCALPRCAMIPRNILLTVLRGKVPKCMLAVGRGLVPWRLGGKN
jgi:hypothetical protein